MRPHLGLLLPHAAERFGEARALTLPGERSWSFRELDDLAARFAGGLRALGVVEGERVVLHLANDWKWIVAYHAIARLGAVVVPANILLTVQEVAFITATAQAGVIILPAERQTAMQALLEADGAACPRLVAPGLDTLIPYEALLEAAPVAQVVGGPDDLSTIAYTSGTTGRPKGAMLTHRAVFASVSLTAEAHLRGPQDVILSALPFPHVYGNVVLNTALLTGARLVAPLRFDADEALLLIERERVTLFEGVPTMYYQMLASPALEGADLTSLTRCTVGGQSTPLAKLRAVVDRFECPLLELWGMTELAGPAVTHSPDGRARLGSIGRPLPGVEARIADPSDRGRDAAAGEPGELMVRGPLLMQGYWENPAATAAAIDADGWFATGDIARQDPDGYLVIVDRKTDLIITAGYNIYPAELEQALAAHPDVAMAAVAPVEDPERGELAKAFVVLRPGARADEAALMAHCRARLAAYKVPRLIAFVDDLPRTSTGKIMRRALREPAPAAAAPAEREMH